MRRFFNLGSLTCAVLLGVRGPANAQGIAALADDIILLSKGASAREKERAHQHLSTPGAPRESRLPPAPGAGAPRLGELAGAGTRPDILAGISQPEGAPRGGAPARITKPTALSQRPTPVTGPLELPTREEEGPSEGLTLDAAIDLLVQRNYDLLTRFQELPKADADILSAGLRLNPLVTGGVDGVPYGRYSDRRPGEVTYSATVIQPVDVNQKRLDRVHVARQAKRVLEAQYQNAVRLEIDNLYTAFVDVLDAREVVRYARASLQLFDEFVQTTKGLTEKGVQPATDLDRVVIQRHKAGLGLQAAEVALRNAKRTLGTLLNLPPEQADNFEVRGTLRAVGPAVPNVEDLIKLAGDARPDLNAFRLGVERAQADVQLSRAERIPDMFVLYTPYSLRDNSQVGAQNASSWGVGVLTTMPAFNRNQGNIRRAQINVTQTQIELEGLERQVISDVQRAALEYAATKDAVRQFEEGILARARKLRDTQFQSYKTGQVGYGVYLEGQREYSEILRDYLDTLMRHRRSMLRINTAVGQRIVP